MAMDTIFATLACCLLALSFATAQTTTPPTRTTGLNLTQVTAALTSSDSTEHVPVTVISNVTEETTQYNTTNLDNGTAATTESTSHPQTSQSATILTPLTNSTSLMTTTPSTQTPTFTVLTTQTIQTTVGHISTSDTSVTTTENSSHTVGTTTDSVGRTQGLGLNISEMNMTIVFSVVLGVFALALVLIMFHKCKHKIQYLHQPLNNTDDTGTFVADDDALVISGGLYDGHPIYDSVPTVSEDQSQFRLEFLH